LPTALVDARVKSLRAKRDSIRDLFDHVDVDIEAKDDIFDSIADRFETVEETREDFHRSYDQAPEADVTDDLYENYIRAVDRLARELNVLETEAVYLDLYQHQNTGHRSTQLEHAAEVCEELKRVFDVDPIVIPVIRNGYAFDPIDEELPSTGGEELNYALILPREGDDRRYDPFLAHEMAHALLDEHPRLRSRFRREVNERDETVSRDGEFGETWTNWFEEFFCDICGLLAYGPAYYCAVVRRLSRHGSFEFERGEDGDPHPPDALRVDVIRELAEREFPDLADCIRDDAIAYDRHLDALEAEKPPDYDTYDDDDLVRFLLEEVPEAIDHDLDALITDIEDGIDPADRPERRHRLEANREWLPSYPPQNGG
jgi:hypothetical protein